MESVFSSTLAGDEVVGCADVGAAKGEEVGKESTLELVGCADVGAAKGEEEGTGVEGGKLGEEEELFPPIPIRSVEESS